MSSSRRRLNLALPAVAKIYKTKNDTPQYLCPKMKLSWGWLAPALLSLLSSKVVHALSSATSVRLVTGITIGLEFGHSSRLQVPQPHHHSLEELSYVQLANHELTLPIMPL